MYKRILKSLGINTDTTVKVYKGFGHEKNLNISGHVFAVSSHPTTRYYKSLFRNIFHLFKLFFVKPVPGASVVLYWNNQQINASTEKDGYFKFEWMSETSVPAGLHEVTVDCVNKSGEIVATGKGQFFVPHITQLGIISDIDDTFLVSHSATIFRRLWTLFTNSAQSRKAFEGVREHYRLLEYAGTKDDTPNPIFYVSSSEWNLYDYLNEFVRIQKLPAGIFLLSQLKRWYQLVKTGKTKHEGKFVRVIRIMEAFPNQQFILLGDNSQKDPEIYHSIVEHFPGRIYAVYIRKVSFRNRDTLNILENKLAARQIPYCLFEHSKTAIEHSKSLGLGPLSTTG
ncbi:MAG TPA: phosphatase domain-containing protein [Flavitalea sp.]|nr:phosphatase domain-containing protein [Flavitalea sp.]